MSAKNLVFAFVLFTLFASLILFFAINLGNEYDRSADEIGGGAFNLSAFESQANSFNANASDKRETFEQGGEGFTLIDNAKGFFSIIIGIGKLIITPFTLLNQVLLNVFGIPTIVTNVLSGLFSFLIIFVIWRLLKLGY